MGRLTALRLAVAASLLAACAGAVAIASQKSAAAMQKAATVFLDSLSPDQKARASFPFDGDERLRWHFIPNETFPRKGLMIKDMNESQRRLAHDLLRSGLSARGYLKVTSIIELEDILKGIEVGGKMARNKEEYLFSIFGTPAAKGNWGWRLEGHHVSLRFAIADGAVANNVSTSPMFLGSNPAEVQDGEKKGLRVLADEEDAARALLMALPAAQQTNAIANAVAPGDILTMNKNDITPAVQQGVAYGSMGSQQQALFTKLIETYASNMEADLAAERMAKIKAAGIDKVYFAWLGETEKGKKHYYRVQGPTFLIEYDNTQNNGNHIHSVWRDFKGDFGRDILREHLREVVH
ncbi:MAG TPA: DUF3500 domain-containing protein [Vicinamibacterales bacterium]|nr:DUF3500 domain-containing protein [Vicinamibacterales bacterium]